MHDGKLPAAPGIDTLHFPKAAEVLLQDHPVIEVVGDVLALNGSELTLQQAAGAVHALLLPPVGKGGPAGRSCKGSHEKGGESVETKQG